MKNCTINVLKAVGDGLNCNQYFLMESGALNISGVGDDGIQVSYETDDDGNRETDEENTGALTVTGGTLTVTTSAVGSKGLKAEGAVVINENSATTLITVKNSGGVDTSDSTDPTSSACLKSDTSIDIAAGTLTLTNTGQGGRAINSEGTLTVTGGIINAQAQGSNYGSSGGGGGGGWPPGGGGRPGGGGSSSSNGKNAKGIKAKGAINISGGSLTVGSANHEGLESKSTMTISGGKVYVKASDDAINSSGNFTISGGYVYAWSTGNDGLDSNGNMSIEGGVALGFASSSNAMATCPSKAVWRLALPAVVTMRSRESMSMSYTVSPSRGATSSPSVAVMTSGQAPARRPTSRSPRSRSRPTAMQL